MSESLDDQVGLLRELCALPKETEWAEFKCSYAKPEEIGEYVSALSNSAALCGKTNGYLVWGVDDASRDLVGTTFRLSRAKKGNEELENWLLRLLAPRIDVHIHEFELDGRLVTMLEIPRASHRPVQFQGHEWVRVGSYKKPLKDFPEKERELWRTFDRTPFESLVAEERLTGSDVLRLLDYPAYFDRLDIPLPEGRDRILEALADDRMIARALGGRWNILNLGAALFAKDLGAFSHLRRKAVRVIVYRGPSRTETVREIPSTQGYAAGYEALIRDINSLLPVNEVIEQAFRRNVPMYPELAVRELVANALIHQDFSMTGAGPVVEIFPDRLEITNPGKPLVEPDRFMDKPPQSRNEALAAFTRRVGICEERGSGIDKVVSATEIFQLPAPLFEAPGDHTRVVLFAHRTFARMDREDRIRACYWHACLQHVKREDLTNTSLRKRFGLGEDNRAQVSRVIGDTLASGLIRARDHESGSRKLARYVPFWA
jgi:ATP-dependent DNA helicase RecG